MTGKDQGDGIPINKAESTPSTVVPSSIAREIGQPRIVTSSAFIQDQRKTDLAMPKRLCTFDNMMQDDAVYNAIDITNIHAVNALSNGSFKSTGTAKSKEAARFLNHSIRNMSQGTWLEAMLNAVTDIQYGFSLLNMVVSLEKHGPWKGSRTLKKLAPRCQKSVYGWVWDKDNREVLGFVQKPMIKTTGRFDVSGFQDGLNLLSAGKLAESGYPFISSNKLLHFTYNKTNNNPQGSPPLVYCYAAWMEKKLVEKYEIVGVSKDLGGSIVLKVPSELIERANDPTNYPNEALEYKQLQEDAACFQAGENSYIVLTSDVDAVTKTPLYDVKFQGIEGGGKQYQTSDIIDQKRKSIYNVFGAGFLLLGQDSHGSYSLSSSATSTHGYYVERILAQKADVINNQMAPRLLAVNDVYLDYEDMPVFVPSDPNEFDLDTLSKVVQRMKSVGGITKEAITHLYEKAGFPLEGIDELTFDDGDTSRGGESQGSSGVGSTQSGGASSATNAENGGVTKNFVMDYETDTHYVAIDSISGKPIFINKEE